MSLNEYENLLRIIQRFWSLIAISEVPERYLHELEELEELCRPYDIDINI